MNQFVKFLMRTLPLALAAFAAGCVSPAGETPEEWRSDIRAMRDESLAQAYERCPELKDSIAKAKGYAVMNNGICKILIIGTVRGYGIVVDSTGKETFVNDFAIALGPGIEIGSSRGIIVFHDAVAMHEYCAGMWDFGGEADLAFKFGDFGGALLGNAAGGPVDTYRVFQNGVAILASVYWMHSGTDPDYNPTPAAAAAPAATN